MKAIYTYLILFVFLNVFVTAQATLIWRGDTSLLFSAPLEMHPDYDSLSRQISDRLRKATLKVPSTACSRDYLAEWTVLNDSIFLSNILHCEDINIKINLRDIFPSIGESRKMFAYWINGELYVPHGELLIREPRFNSLFEYETVLHVENGIIQSYETFHNRIERRVDFSWGVLSSFILYNTNWEILPDMGNRWVDVFVAVQPNEQGQFESVIEEYTFLLKAPQTCLDEDFIRDTNNIFIREVIRVAKLVPEWNVIYQRGEILPNPVRVTFSERERRRWVSR